MAGKGPENVAPDSCEFTITRSFPVPRPIVFESWTKPEILASCCSFGGFTFNVIDSDLRPGGSFHHRMRSADGDEYSSPGVFLEVVAPERIVSVSRWYDANGNPNGSETRLVLTFQERNGTTELTLHQSGFATAQERDAVRQGMTMTLGRFDEYLTAQAR